MEDQNLRKVLYEKKSPVDLYRWNDRNGKRL